MKIAQLAFTSATFAIALAANASPAQISFSGTVNFVATNAPYPAVGSQIGGVYIFDYDSAAYALTGAPREGANYAGYSYVSGLYGLAANLSGLSPSATTGSLAVEVYDNGSVIPENMIPSDTILFSTKQNATIYRLNLTGPNSTFAGNALPNQATLQGQWATRTFSIYDSSINLALQANISSLTVSQVPEPTPFFMSVFGVGVLIAQVRRVKRVNA